MPNPNPVFIASEADTEQRIDNFLFKYCKRIPKALFYKQLRKGIIRVNDKKVSQTYRIQAGDKVSLPTTKEGAPEKLKKMQTAQEVWDPSWVLYEDEVLIAINKPSGIAVHGGSGISLGVIERLRLARPEAIGLELVHRLDRGTSGILLIAKKRKALRHLQEQLMEQKLKKTYLALVEGKWPSALNLVKLPLKKCVLKTGGRFVKVCLEGKPAETRVIVRQYFSEVATLLELYPKTGRTHQIRVHTAHNGHPILGDERYGRDKQADFHPALKLKRLYLHAHQLSFIHPTSQLKMTLKAKTDLRWKQYADNLMQESVQIK